VQRGLLGRALARVEAVEGPVAGLHGELLVLEARGEVVAVGDAVAVRDDEGWSVVGVRLGERVDGLLVLRPHGHGGHVDMPVVHGVAAEILLPAGLPAGGELGDRPQRGRLGGLAPRVRVDLGVEDEEVDVPAAGEDLVDPAEADVVGPAVAPHRPDGLADEGVGERAQLGRPRPLQRAEAFPEGGHPFPLGPDRGVAVLDGPEEGVREVLPDLPGELADEFPRPRLVRIHRQADPVAELGVVLEEGVRPRRPPPVLVDGVGRGGEVASVNGGAAGGVGEEEAVPGELGEQLQVGRLPAARTGPGELEERLAELAVLHVHPQVLRGRLGEGEEVVELRALLLEEERVDRGQVERLPPGLAAVLRRADVHAEVAAGAVLRGHLDGVLVVMQVAGAEVEAGEAGRRVPQGIVRVGLRPDGRVRADEGALPALDAEVRLPRGHLQAQPALLPLGGRGRPGAVGGEGGDRQAVALPGEEDAGHPLHEVGCLRRDRWRAGAAPARLGGHLHLVEMGEGGVDGGEVLLDDRPALPSVGLLDGALDLRDRLLAGQDAGDREEAGLHDRVDPLAHARLLGDGVGVDHVEAEALLHDRLADLAGQAFPDFPRARLRVQEEDGAGRGHAEDLLAVEEGELVATHKLGPLHEPGGLHRTGPEAEVGDGGGAGLLAVVDEVGLRVVVGLLADDLDGVLVRADGAVRAEAVEDGPEDFVRLDGEGFLHGEGVVGDVVDDPDREVVARPLGAEVVEDGLRHRRVELLGAKPVASPHHEGREIRGQLALRPAFVQGGDHVLVEGLPGRAGLLGPVEHGDAASGQGEGLQEAAHGEGAEEVHLEHAHAAPVPAEGLRGRLDGLRPGTHDHDDLLRVLRPGIAEEPVGTAGLPEEFLAAVLHEARQGLVVGVGRLAGLEEGIGILGRPPDHRGLRGEGPLPVGGDRPRVDEGRHLLGAQALVGIDLVRGAEAVEEMEEGHPGPQGGGMGDRREVLRGSTRAAICSGRRRS